MLAATRGEYKGIGQTHTEKQIQQKGSIQGWIVLCLFFVFLFINIFSRRQSYGGSPTIFTSNGSSFWDGGGGSGGGGSSDSFSGGGGDSGGGGAGGSW